MISISHVVQKVKEHRAERRASRPERLQRRAVAKAHRIEMKRAHETDMRGRGGGRS